MYYSISSSTKILKLTTAPFLFVLVPSLSVNFLWCQECIFFLYPQEKEVHSSSWGHRYIYTHSAAQSSKMFKPLPVTILLWQGHCWIEKKHKQGTELCLWCLSDQVALWNSYLFLISVHVWAIFSLKDRQQTAFVTLNRFCPLSKLPPPSVLNEQNQAGWNPKQR